jgi:predicted DNA binding CopG/RHH family protein
MPKHSPLYEFLKSTGVLETGDKERISEAKKQYRKQYLTKQKQQYRKAKKHIAVILEDHELTTLESKAIQHGLSLPQYIKQSALHYQAGLFLVPNPNSYLEIKELVYAIYRQIQEIQNKEKSRWFGSINEYDSMKQVILGLLPQTEKLFSNPVSLIEAIDEQLKSNLQFKNTLQELLKKYDT